jgi:hypothetical protein
VFYLEYIVGASLNVFGYLMAMGRSQREGSQDQQVQSTPEEFDLVAALFHG